MHFVIVAHTEDNTYLIGPTINVKKTSIEV